MTLRELVDEVQFRTGDVEAPDAGLIVRMLNRAQQECARELEIPQVFVNMQNVTGEVNLPSDARDSALVEIRRAIDGTSLLVLTAEEASARYPNWEDWDEGEPLFFVFDPKISGIGLRPVPLPASGASYDYDLKYLAKPADMLGWNDTPWDGAMQDHHMLIVHKVVYEVMLARGDDRRQEHYGRYMQMMQEAYQATRPRPVRPNNPLHRRIMGRSW